MRSVPLALISGCVLVGTAVAQPAPPPAPTAPSAPPAPPASPTAVEPPPTPPPPPEPPPPPVGHHDHADDDDHAEAHGRAESHDEDSDSTRDDDDDDDADHDGGHHGDHHGKHKGDVSYKPRKGISVNVGKTKLRFFTGVESVLKENHCSGDACAPADGITWHVRRARFSIAAKLKHHLSIDFGIQVKNEIIVLKNANFSWKHDGLTLKTGFLKPPGGMERDSSTWVKPFPERSVVANFKQDRIVGLMATEWTADKTLRFQQAAGHPPVGNFDAFEPEDVVAPPPGIEPEDLTTDPGNWDLFATGTYTPSPNFEVSLNATAHTSPDAGKGPNFAEPYETKILKLKYIKGTFLAGGGDVVWHNAHVRASAEFVGFHSGQTIPQVDAMGNPLEPVAHEHGEAGYAVIGFTPDGEYGPAIDNAPLLHGWQVMARGEFLRVTPGVTAGTTALFGSVTTGLDWQVYPQLRLQFDVAVQKFNENVDPANHNVWRVYSELWGQVLL